MGMYWLVWDGETNEALLVGVIEWFPDAVTLDLVLAAAPWANAQVVREWFAGREAHRLHMVCDNGGTPWDVGNRPVPWITDGVA